VLSVESISVAYGRDLAVADISFEVGKGDRVALLGGNGSGKTTVLRAISRLLPLAAGAIRLNGERIDGLSPEEVVRRGLVHVPQGRQLWPELTVRQHLEMGATVLGMAPRALALEIDAKLEASPLLRARASSRAGDLSGGEQQQLAVLRALMLRPKVMLLDEPSQSLSPLLVQQLARTVADSCAGEVALVVAEQNLAFAAAVSRRALVLVDGQIAAEGETDSFLAGAAFGLHDSR
jgi:branched-chain amino acid transport system ATP-binding protein